MASNGHNSSLQYTADYSLWHGRHQKVNIPSVLPPKDTERVLPKKRGKTNGLTKFGRGKQERMAEDEEKPGFFAEKFFADIKSFIGCGERDSPGDPTNSGAKDRPARTHEILSSVPNPGMTHLSTSPTARSSMESADTRNGRGISPNPMARPLKDSLSIPTRLSTSPTARSRSSNTSPTAVARPQQSYGDIKLEHLKLERQQSPPAKTLFKAEWKSFGLFGCLADHTMNECINLMKLESYSKGETIIRRGSLGTTLFFMDLGSARVSLKEHEYANIKSGEYFGEIAFVAMCKKLLDDNHNLSDDTPEKAIRLADVTAHTACRTLVLEARNFVDLLKKHPECKERLMRSLNRTAQEHRAHVQEVQDQFFHHEDAQGAKARSERQKEAVYDIKYGRR